MRDIETFDPDLFGEWPETAIHDDSGGSGWSAEACRLAAEVCMIETKSGDPQEMLRTLLNDMTSEMRQQFDLFRKLRAAAEILAEGEDEAAAKLARADIKAAVDAMSLIIRTLEKIDALQRQIVRDRELESERNADGAGYEDAKKRLLAIVEQRVGDRVAAILAERQRGDLPDLPPCGGDVGGSRQRGVGAKDTECAASSPSVISGGAVSTDHQTSRS